MLDKDVVPTLLSLATPSSEFGTDEEWELTLRFATEHREQNLAEIIFNIQPPQLIHAKSEH
jgi:hypothetical protein